MAWILSVLQRNPAFTSSLNNMVLLYSLVVAFAVISKAFAAPFVVSPSPTHATNYQKWAHYHWVWLKNSDGNQANETALIQGYKDNNIPVGALNIDSTWATQFNNFVVDTNRFPDFKGMVSNFHDQGIKVILWATSMVNTDNPDYQMCVENQYLIRNSHGVVRPLEWWHGSGGLLDYTNPEALKWWHAQMDLVLDAGVDGFKCDGTDPYIDEYTLTGGALGYNDKVITYRDYANSYYRDFFEYTRAKRSDNVPGADAGLIMSRPVDCLLDGVSKACTPFSPYNVMYSGWMGDDDSSFLGLRACAHKVIYSAWLGYGNYGCDIGGYRGGADTKYATHFLRSAQLNAFLPLMENGGGGEHRPWMYEESYVVPVYRKFVQQHYRLSAYLLTNGANAVDTNTSAIHPLDYRTIADIADFSLQNQQKQEKAASIDVSPSRDTVTNDFLNALRLQKQNTVAKHATHDDHNIHIVFPNPKTLAYLLGQDILVHPVMYDQDNRTASAVVHVEFPELASVLPVTKEASGTVWLDWWNPSDVKKQHAAGTSATVVVPIETFPVYVRKGAFIPLHPVRAVRATNDGATVEQTLTEEALLSKDTSVDLDRVLFTWFAPSTARDADHPVSFALRESISEGTGMVAKASFTTADTLVATISAHRGALRAGVSLIGVTEPSAVTVEAWADSRCVHSYTQHTSTFTVSCASVAGGLKVTLSGVKTTL